MEFKVIPGGVHTFCVCRHLHTEWPNGSIELGKCCIDPVLCVFGKMRGGGDDVQFASSSYANAATSS